MNRKYTVLASMALVVAFSFLTWNVKSTFALVLVQDGQAKATIVIAQDASPQVQKAAKTLQKYIKQSSGAELPIANSANDIAINVGQTGAVRNAAIDVTKLDQDGFVLQGIDDHNYVIIGGSDLGTEHGVNDFLERYLGVRWLMPTDLGTDVPKHQSIDIPATKIVQEPVYLSRELSPGKGRNPLTTWEHYNNSPRGRVRFSHYLLRLFPVSKFGTTHPEFYPIINGERYIPKSDTDHRWQPNLSAAGIVDAAVEQIEKYFQENPDATSYSLGMNDSNNWDQSDASKARRSGKTNYLGREDISDDYFTWANAVVEKVLLKYPDKWFGTLAYNGLAEPPEKVKINPRIVPFMTYDRMRWEDPELRDFGRQLTERWAKVSPVLGWYDYTYGRSFLLPRVYFHRMQEYLSWGVSHNVKFSYSELYPNWGEGPKPWIYTKLLWNPNQNVDDLLDDWYTHFAGVEAAPKLNEFYAIWEKFWTVDILKSEWTRNANIYHRNYLPFAGEPTYLLDVPESYIAQSDAAMQAALELADTPQRKARVAKLKEMWDFYKASIITYQGEHLANNVDLKTEQQALALLDKVEDVLVQVGKRQQLLAAFAKDPLYSASADYITRSPNTAGGGWGTSLLWRLQPWAEKSPQVKVRLQQLANSSDKTVRQQVNIFLQAVNKNDTLVSSNAGFESGEKGWRLWDKASEIITYNRGTWAVSTDKAHSGTHSLSIKGLQRGGPVQSISYKPGSYFARAYCYVPQNSKIGTARLTLGVSVNGKPNNEFPMPSSNIVLQPGTWSSIVIPFTLPKASKSEATGVSLLLAVDGFDPDGQIYLDDVGIYRIGDNQ